VSLPRLLPLLLLAALALTPAAQAKPKYRVGMGDQSPAMFANRSWKALDLERVRYIVPWDGVRHSAQRTEIDAFVAAARAARQDILVSFSARRGCFDGRYSRAKRCRPPTPGRFRSAFLAFKRRYPDIRTYSPWNEANHVSQPTYRRPRLAAAYYEKVRRACPKCRIVALDVLDTSNMVGYLQQFRRYASNRARIWGIHNYADVNRRRDRMTRAMLARVPGEVWMTETGGLVAFGPSFPYSQSRAAARTRDLFRLAGAFDTRRPGLRSRISRVYPYQWTGVPRGARFDAGLVNPNGRPRPAYHVFKRLARRVPR